MLRGGQVLQLLLGHAVVHVARGALEVLGVDLAALGGKGGARGALLYSGCVPPDAFADRWPAAVPVQLHGMDADEDFVGEGDLDAARLLVAAADDAELFLYPGTAHLFADPGIDGYDPGAAAALTERTLGFLARVG